MTRGIELLSIPYDSARRGWRMGAGPSALQRAGLVQRLRAVTRDVELVPIEDASSTDPVTSAFDLAARTARVVRAAVHGGRLPILLTGNCIGTVGMLAGAAPRRPLVLWLDAHADLNTPETSASGFLDGMSAATCLGWCHREHTGLLDGFVPLAGDALILVGARDIDPPEQAAIERSGIKVLAAGSALANVGGGDGEDLFIHLDLDVLDPAEVGRANQFAVADGLTAAAVIEIVGAAAAGRSIAGLTVSAYDPAADADGAVAAAALDIITAVAGMAGA